MPRFSSQLVRYVEAEMRSIDIDYYNRTLAEAYGEHHHRHVDYDDELETDPDFHRWRENHWPRVLRAYVQNVVAAFQKVNPVPIYRMITQTTPWLRRLSPDEALGIYWSDDPRNARRYYDNRVRGGKDFLFSATVDHSGVEWITTIALQIMNDAETEVRLIAGAEVVLTGIRTGESTVRSDLIGRRFRA